MNLTHEFLSDVLAVQEDRMSLDGEIYYGLVFEPRLQVPEWKRELTLTDLVRHNGNVKLYSAPKESTGKIEQKDGFYGWLKRAPEKTSHIPVVFSFDYYD